MYGRTVRYGYIDVLMSGCTDTVRTDLLMLHCNMYSCADVPMDVQMRQR
jgi:hypothetical protein